MNKSKKIALAAIASFCFSAPSMAQDKQTVKPFNHLDLSVTAGSTGLGFELSAPVTDWVDVRAGGTFMPYFEKKLGFEITVGKYTYNPELTPAQNAELEKETFKNRFNKLSSVLESFSGYHAENSVDMIGTPSMNNFKFVADFHPFKDKNWRVSAGFFIGGKVVGNAVNSQEAMNCLLAASMYNNMYKKTMGWDNLIEYNGVGIASDNFYKLFAEYGEMAIPIGKVAHDIIAEEDIYYDYTKMACGFDDFDDPRWGEADFEGWNKDSNGDVHGTLLCKKGEPVMRADDQFRMYPDENNMVTAKAKINRFKPYLGFGYGGAISNDGRTRLSFDAGLMFWGGVPKVETRTPVGLNKDGETVYVTVDMCRDLKNLTGNTGEYVDLIKKFPVFPVLNICITQRLF